MDNTRIALFKGKKIRRTIYQNEWWFSIVDIIEALTATERPRKYWNDLKKKLVNEGYYEVSEKIGQLKLLAPDGKMRETDCANTETVFRIIQTTPCWASGPRQKFIATKTHKDYQNLTRMQKLVEELPEEQEKN